MIVGRSESHRPVRLPRSDTAGGNANVPNVVSESSSVVKKEKINALGSRDLLPLIRRNHEWGGSRMWLSCG